MNHRRSLYVQTDRQTDSYTGCNAAVQSIETRFRPFKAQTGTRADLQPLQAACVEIREWTNMNKTRRQPRCNSSSSSSARSFTTFFKRNLRVLFSKFGLSAERGVRGVSVLSKFSRSLEVWVWMTNKWWSAGFLKADRKSQEHRKCYNVCDGAHSLSGKTFKVLYSTAQTKSEIFVSRKLRDKF